ncbi:hypothetical protein NDU88_005737 [Pleurodeles waltl]|uniref:Uncharacterized protein n=1 Tax=Pleurodeles waltl TaxID=8319 RepID=A0AAV7WAF0_PLEWA|nr:hypothetical protein NDU88_005737 [Pleurodeles waltl]
MKKLLTTWNWSPSSRKDPKRWTYQVTTSQNMWAQNTAGVLNNVSEERMGSTMKKTVEQPSSECECKKQNQLQSALCGLKEGQLHRDL